MQGLACRRRTISVAKKLSHTYDTESSKQSTCQRGTPACFQGESLGRNKNGRISFLCTGQVEQDHDYVEAGQRSRTFPFYSFFPPHRYRHAHLGNDRVGKMTDGIGEMAKSFSLSAFGLIMVNLLLYLFYTLTRFHNSTSL
jgi:hypothetical protein